MDPRRSSWLRTRRRRVVMTLGVHGALDAAMIWNTPSSPTPRTTQTRWTSGGLLRSRTSRRSAMVSSPCAPPPECHRRRPCSRRRTPGPRAAHSSTVVDAIIRARTQRRPGPSARTGRPADESSRPAPMGSKLWPPSSRSRRGCRSVGLDPSGSQLSANSRRRPLWTGPSISSPGSTRRGPGAEMFLGDLARLGLLTTRDGY